MEFINETARVLSNLIHPYMHHVALAIVATILVIYGEDINAMIRAQIKQYNFFVRIFVFVLVCAFGYGMLTIFLTVLVRKFLAQLSPVYLISVLAGFFFILGILAERKKQI